MTGHDAQALRRLEAKVDMLLRHIAEETIELREQNVRLSDEAAGAYRRGYSAGFSTAARGGPNDPESALSKRRKRR